MFSPYVAEQLGFYVYLLVDPRDEVVFYVGKGTGNRIFDHAQDALQFADTGDKLDRIRAIRAEGHDVRHELLRFGMNERTAFDVEAAVIDLLGLERLTNVVSGHHIASRGRMTTDVAISLFDAPRAPEITEPVILLRIPRLWYPSMPAAELFEATRGWWTVGKRREQAAYAFAVSRGVVREVYRIDSWRRRELGDRGADATDRAGRARWGFAGEAADELGRYRNTSVAHLFRPGESSPFKYLNC